MAVVGTTAPVQTAAARVGGGGGEGGCSVEVYTVPSQ